MNATVEKLEAEIKKDQKIVREGIVYHDAVELQLAKDRIAMNAKKIRDIDFDNRKPFIKVETVNRPTGNSSTKARVSKRFAINGGGKATLATL